MATFTEHYDLIKPGTDDYYDVADFNENMDAIDTQLYQAEQDMAGVSEKIGNPGDEGEDTLFGCSIPVISRKRKRISTVIPQQRSKKISAIGFQSPPAADFTESLQLFVLKKTVLFI